MSKQQTRRELAEQGDAILKRAHRDADRRHQQYWRNKGAENKRPGRRWQKTIMDSQSPPRAGVGVVLRQTEGPAEASPNRMRF